MTRKQLFAIAAAVLGAALLVRWKCGSDWPDHEGQIRQTAHLQGNGLRRGATGAVRLSVIGHYTRGDADAVQTFAIRKVSSPTLTLVSSTGVSTALQVDWDQRRSGHGALALPEVADGDYTLRATFETRIGKGEVELPLPLYSPARVHVVTDRPLYEAGNVVRFRAVVLRARDLTPIDGRPGRWVIRDPGNEVVLEEIAPAGEFGVVAGSFPLDRAAQVGTWHVQWISDSATDDVEFLVQPFTLPRFSVDAAPDKPFYTGNDTPVIRGAAMYASGAPVSGAALQIQWTSSGDWPLPTQWQESLLPTRASTGGDGQFVLTLPRIPQDLQRQTTLMARISAVDQAGDRVAASVAVLLSEDAIAVSAVTELGDGLAQGFNNRLYLRVTTADGRVLQNAKLNVRRAWQLSDPGIAATVDEDGVAALQLDPGPPVNVVIPAPPWRPQPRPQMVSRDQPDELIGGAGASLAEQVEMDRWLAALEPCSKWHSSESASARIGLRVNAAGAVTAAIGAPGRLDQCVAAILRRRRLPAGPERMFTIGFTFADPDLPTLHPEVISTIAAPDGFATAIEEIAASTRDCLPAQQEGELPRALTWSVRAGSKDVEFGTWIDQPRGGAASAAMACVTTRFSTGRLRLESGAGSDAMGLIRFSVALPARSRVPRPQPTTVLGYEFTVSAELEGKTGTTKLRIMPGEIPDLRMRVTPVLAKAGEVVTAELIRGPKFSGQLPQQLALGCLKQSTLSKLTSERRATFTLDPTVQGWCEISGGGTRALIFIKPPSNLAVTVVPQQPRYAPGQQATLLVNTSVSGKGAKAAVGLFGVDQSLGQLIPLVGADDFGRILPKVGTSTAAFGSFDGQALTLGRIQGANAAAATVLRVTSIPSAPETDAVVNGNAATAFDPLEELTDRFYVVLAELYVQARQWEASAPPSEKMRPQAMAELWQKALAACAKRGQRVDDAYGRKLRLRLLPPDLLALTDPHVVVTGTRLPEDVENWAAWVAQRRP